MNRLCWLPGFCSVCLLAVCFGAVARRAAAQQVIQTPDGKTVTIPAGADPAAIQAMMQQRAAGRPGGPPPNPGAKDKKEAEGKDKDEKKDDQKDDKKDGPLENIKRSAKPPEAPDPDELKVPLDEDGLVQFQFRNQPWPDVLRWYADICNLSLDWQELPGDYINLATQRPYSLEETGDMINRALLMRGFTMLQEEDTLTIVKTEGLNPSLVPRVRPDELSALPPHRYVRTSFSLSWLLAEEVHSEFASMISKNGKLTPLQSTNRLEAMDAASNLRDINDILEQEQSAIAMENLAREFPLKHARAASVKQQLETFLGIQNSSGGGGPMSSSSARMIQQQMQQMQQQLQQAARNAAKSGGGGGAATRKRPDQVYLVANERSNSVIVHAPPNKMAIIASFINRVDVQNATSTDYQRLNTRMKVFRLASLGPSELVATLNSMDVLEPATRLQVDENNNAIIAYASIADQYLISSVIERLDGSERSFQVVQLRRQDAESVAGTIKVLMGLDEEEDDNSRNRNRYYGFYDYYGSRSSSKKSKDKMRVGANIQDNQLLLWVNDIEMEEVENLLVKLGEIPPEGGQRTTMRIIDASRRPETYEYLQRLKEQWEKASPNPLIIPDAAEFEPEDEPEAEAAQDPDDGDTEDSSEADDNPDAAPEVDTAKDKITRSATPSVQNRLVWTQATPTDDASPQAAPADGADPTESGSVPPVKIFVDEAGNLVIQSDDVEALDRLEEIMQVNRPPRRPYDIFKVKHARASWVALNLKEYFDKNEDDDRPRFYSIFFDGFGGNNDDDKGRQLGDRPPLRFISDNDTNSIVVQGADDLDRQTIKDLIELWDVPEPIDETGVRYTRLVRIRYSRAESIVNALKEAYRDLLSANDKTFQQNQGEGGGDGENKRNGGGQGVSAGGGLSFGGFKGKLSLGPEPLTNSVLVSAEGKPLLDLICDMIEELDEAAKQQGNVEVYQVPAGINGASLEKTLQALFQNSKQNKQGKDQKDQAAAAQQQAEQAAAAQQAAQQAAPRARSGRR